MEQQEASTSAGGPSRNINHLELLMDDFFGTEFKGLDFLDPLAGFGCDDTNVGATGSCRGKRAALEDDGSDDDSDNEGAKDKGPACKKAKAEANQAARNKASREKARRERMNERFSELARIIDPGKDPKTDKPTILADAIKFIQSLLVQNHQLRQLNKLLEERVAQNDRARGAQLYQQFMTLNHQQQHGLGYPGMSFPHALPQHQQQQHQAAQQPQQPQQPQAQLTASLTSQDLPGALNNPANNRIVDPNASLMFPGEFAQQMQQLPYQPPASLDPLNGAPSKPLLLNFAGPLSVPTPYWLSPDMLDTTQDSLLRPPAA